jgi:acyl-coenzyme A synthetase/AMP-(fatty) acid ligase
LNKTAVDILYSTGDIGRYLIDGSIQFVGRVDSQVKIRGNRVELPEVERTIKAYPSIEEVVVLMIKSEDEDILACYFTYNAAVEESALREYVASYLPDYMHPSY